MKKSFFKSYLLAALITYFIIAFCCLDLNAFNWPYIGRIMFVIFGYGLGDFFYGMAKKTKQGNDKQ